MNNRPQAPAQRVTRRLTVLNELGLHARPATEFVKSVRMFRSEVWIVRDDGKRFRADRILDVLTADLPQGSMFTIEAVGKDARDVVERLEKLMQDVQ